MKAKTNMTMLCDFYELTMGNGYFQTGLTDRICYFDVFYRSVPDQGGFAIAAGLAQVVEYIENYRLSAVQGLLCGGVSGLSEKLLLHRRHLGGSGGDAHLPGGAHSHGPGPRHPGPVY